MDGWGSKDFCFDIFGSLTICKEKKRVDVCHFVGDAYEFSRICYGVIVVAIVSSCHHHHCGCHEQHHHCHDHPEIVINIVVLDINNGYNGVVVVVGVVLAAV